MLTLPKDLYPREPFTSKIENSKFSATSGEKKTSDIFLPTATIGDLIHKLLPSLWSSQGKHIFDPSLRNKGDWTVTEIRHKKSDLLPKGFNTIASALKFIIAPINTLQTNTKFTEHDWVLLKIRDPENKETSWLSAWSNAKGDLIVQEHLTKGAANRSASCTLNNSAGGGVHTIDRLKHQEYSVNNLLNLITEVTPYHHLTQKNCKDFAKYIMDSCNENRKLDSTESWKSICSFSTDISLSTFINPKELTPVESGIPYLNFRVDVLGPYRNSLATFSGKKPEAVRQKAQQFIRDQTNRNALQGIKSIDLSDDFWKARQHFLKVTSHTGTVMSPNTALKSIHKINTVSEYDSPGGFWRSLSSIFHGFDKGVVWDANDISIEQPQFPEGIIIKPGDHYDKKTGNFYRNGEQIFPIVNEEINEWKINGTTAIMEVELEDLELKTQLQEFGEELLQSEEFHESVKEFTLTIFNQITNNDECPQAKEKKSPSPNKVKKVSFGNVYENYTGVNIETTNNIRSGIGIDIGNAVQGGGSILVCVTMELSREGVLALMTAAGLSSLGIGAGLIAIGATINHFVTKHEQRVLTKLSNSQRHTFDQLNFINNTILPSLKKLSQNINDGKVHLSENIMQLDKDISHLDHEASKISERAAYAEKKEYKDQKKEHLKALRMTDSLRRDLISFKIFLENQEKIEATAKTYEGLPISNLSDKIKELGLQSSLSTFEFGLAIALKRQLLEKLLSCDDSNLIKEVVNEIGKLCFIEPSTLPLLNFGLGYGTLDSRSIKDVNKINEEAELIEEKRSQGESADQSIDSLINHIKRIKKTWKANKDHRIKNNSKQEYNARYLKLDEYIDILTLEKNSPLETFLFFDCDDYQLISSKENELLIADYEKEINTLYRDCAFEDCEKKMVELEQCIEDDPAVVALCKKTRKNIYLYINYQNAMEGTKKIAETSFYLLNSYVKRFGTITQKKIVESSIFLNRLAPNYLSMQALLPISYCLGHKNTWDSLWDNYTKEQWEWLRDPLALKNIPGNMSSIQLVGNTAIDFFEWSDESRRYIKGANRIFTVISEGAQLYNGYKAIQAGKNGAGLSFLNIALPIVVEAYISGKTGSEGKLSVDPDWYINCAAGRCLAQIPSFMVPGLGPLNLLLQSTILTYEVFSNNSKEKALSAALKNIQFIDIQEKNILEKISKTNESPELYEDQLTQYQTKKQYFYESIKKILDNTKGIYDYWQYCESESEIIKQAKIAHYSHRLRKFETQKNYAAILENTNYQGSNSDFLNPQEIPLIKIPLALLFRLKAHIATSSKSEDFWKDYSVFKKKFTSWIKESNSYLPEAIHKDILFLLSELEVVGYYKTLVEIVNKEEISEPLFKGYITKLKSTLNKTEKFYSENNHLLETYDLQKISDEALPNLCKKARLKIAGLAFKKCDQNDYIQGRAYLMWVEDKKFWEDICHYDLSSFREKDYIETEYLISLSKLISDNPEDALIELKRIANSMQTPAVWYYIALALCLLYEKSPGDFTSKLRLNVLIEFYLGKFFHHHAQLTKERLELLPGNQQDETIKIYRHAQTLQQQLSKVPSKFQLCLLGEDPWTLIERFNSDWCNKIDFNESISIKQRLHTHYVTIAKVFSVACICFISLTICWSSYEINRAMH